MTNWIKCSEKLPSSYRTVLIYGDDGIVECAQCFFRSDDSLGYVNVVSNVPGYNPRKIITHWAELPEPPND